MAHQTSTTSTSGSWPAVADNWCSGVRCISDVNGDRCAAGERTKSPQASLRGSLRHPARQRHVHGRRRDDRGDGWPGRGGSCWRGAQVHELGDRAAPSGGHARERAVRHRVAGGLTRPSRVTVVPWRRSPPAGSLMSLSPLFTEVPRRGILRTPLRRRSQKFGIGYLRLFLRQSRASSP